MTGLLRRARRLLGSPFFATGLLVFIGAWAAAASVIPQGEPSAEGVEMWAQAHPFIEDIVSLLGLHLAFRSPIFVVCTLALALSTGICSWQRTKVAIHRARLLRLATSGSARKLSENHQIEIACRTGLAADEALTIAADTLDELGLRTARHDDILRGVSAPWTVFGSPVFHWALLALMALVVLGVMQRSEGLMGIAVGETKPDVPGSYGVLNAGPLHDWAGVHRAIRLDEFRQSYVVDGLDRGPTPTVSLLDKAGNVIKSQPVYPNKPLRSKSLTIHSSDYGLAVRVSLRDLSGATVSRILLVDFSEEATSGTRPAGFIPVASADRTQRFRLFATVPLERADDGPGWQLPSSPAARIVVTTDDNRALGERVLASGDELRLPAGATVRLDDVGWYARLSVVEDRTVPFVYAVMAIAVAGLTVTLLARQQLVLVAIVGAPGELRLVADVRLWRNTSVDTREAVEELTERIGPTS